MEERRIARDAASEGVHPESDGLQSITRSQENDKFLGPQRTSLELPEVLDQTSYSLKQVIGPTSYGGPHSFNEVQQSFEVPVNKRQWRCCGLSVWMFVVLLVVGILAVLGAVLGGVLGTVVQRHSTYVQIVFLYLHLLIGKPTSPLSCNSINNCTTPAMENLLPKPIGRSGATTLILPPSENILLYYQLENNSIIEASFPVTSLNNASSDLTDFNWTIAVNTADAQSPLSAISWIDEASNATIVG